MATLISALNIGKYYGVRQLFKGITLHVNSGDKIGLIGPNGSGKSTMLKILAGLEGYDQGELIVRQKTRIAYVPQEPKFDGTMTVAEVLAASYDDYFKNQEHSDGDRQAAVSRALGRVGFNDKNQLAGHLSGGWLRRLSFAQALVADPEVLLLDEPTNHLDLEGILWLEQLLQDQNLAVVTVTHDRAFLQNVCTHIWEIDGHYPDGYLAGKGNYQQFLEQKEAFFNSLAAYQAGLANRARRENDWLHHGAPARSTKAAARSAAAKAMLKELAELKSLGHTQSIDFGFSATSRQTRRLIVAKDLALKLGQKELFKNLNFILGPKMTIGLVGPNGSGKSSLLKILAGQIKEFQGELFKADNLQTVYFDQQREQLDNQQSLKEALVESGDKVIYQGRSIHVAGWAERFLFRPEQLQMRLDMLSGGEQARVLIARLMLRPADIMLLDEPTNNLDIPTIAILEDALEEFTGGVILVTHDRALLENVCDLVIGLDDRGNAILCADFSQYRQYMADLRKADKEASRPQAKTPVKEKNKSALTYGEQLEYNGLEEKIMAAEEELSAAQEALNDPSISANAKKLQEACAVVEAAQQNVDKLYARWEELEAKKNSSPC